MTNNKQQTALEIFWNQLPEILPFTVDTETAVKLHEAYEQAKEMQKQQITKAIDDQYNYDMWPSSIPTLGQQYYNETYGK
jgi:hypothetical protein